MTMIDQEEAKRLADLFNSVDDENQLRSIFDNVYRVASKGGYSLILGDILPNPRVLEEITKNGFGWYENDSGEWEMSWRYS